jgi:hypothetical protein
VVSSVDDSTLLAQINKTNINREATRWDWNIIYELVAGPLTIPKNFALAKKNTRFLKNLLGYFLISKR